MKVRYEFANGDVSEIEVDEEYGQIVMQSRREEKALQERERYHCCSLDAMDYEGEVFADYNTPEKDMEEQFLKGKIDEALSQLTATQRRRLLMLADGKTMHQIAEIEECDFKAVWKSINQAREKLKNFF